MPEHRRVRHLVMAALLAALTGVSSLFAVPNPFLPSVPFTLQVFVVCLAGAVLPPGWAAAAEAVYLLLGAIGLPVFAGGSSGVAVLFSVTGGFLWGFPPAAAAAAAVAGRAAGVWRLCLAGLAAIAVLYACGYAGLVVFGRLPADWRTFAGLLTFLPWDTGKALLAAVVAVRVRKALAAEADAPAA